MVPWGRWPWVKLAHGLDRGGVVGPDSLDCDRDGVDGKLCSREHEGVVLNRRVDPGNTICLRRACEILRAMEGLEWERN